MWLVWKWIHIVHKKINFHGEWLLFSWTKFISYYLLYSQFYCISFWSRANKIVHTFDEKLWRKKNLCKRATIYKFQVVMHLYLFSLNYSVNLSVAKSPVLNCSIKSWFASYYHNNIVIITNTFLNFNH